MENDACQTRIHHQWRRSKDSESIIILWLRKEKGNSTIVVWMESQRRVIQKLHLEAKTIKRGDVWKDSQTITRHDELSRDTQRQRIWDLVDN